MNFVEEQEELSLSIWTPLDCDGKRRQAKGKRVADCVVRERISEWLSRSERREWAQPMKMMGGKGFFGIHEMLT